MGLMLLATLIAILVALRLTAPRQRVAHAARVKFLEGPILRRFVERGPIVDQAGAIIPLTNKEIFIADGDSMASHDIPAGAACVAEKLNDESRRTLSVGDIVIVDARTERSQTGLRFRKIAAIDDGNVRFENHNPRALNLVRAKVTHVLMAA